MRLTKHGKDRASERTGLPAKATAKLASEALARGYPAKAYAGRFRRYLDMLGLQKRSARVLVHGNHIFLFGKGDELITVLNTPSKYLKYKPHQEQPQ